MPSRSEQNDTQQHSNNAVKKWKHQCVTVVQHYQKAKTEREKVIIKQQEQRPGFLLLCRIHFP